MGRSIRFIPEGGSLVEVTCRTIQGRFLLRPEEGLNRVVKGVLARAARLYEVQVVAAVYLSNHFHLLVWVDHAQRLARFMAYLNGNLAREVGRLHGWREKFWARRYQAVLVSDEEEVQVARLRYLLSHGAKENLVRRPQDWPGVHCAEALASGAPLQGVWINRSQEYHVRRRGKPLILGEFAEVETLPFVQLPCWAHLSAERYRENIRALLDAIEQEAEERRRVEGFSLPARRVCRRRILRQHPHSAHKKPQKRPVPLVHALRTSVRKEICEAYSLFLFAFREASRKLRRGETGAVFPPGSFPPAQPFVMAAAARAP